MSPRHVEISYGYTLKFRGRLRGASIDTLVEVPLTASDDDAARTRAVAILAAYRFRLEELELRLDADRKYVPLYAPRHAWEALE